jgi:transposase
VRSNLDGRCFTVKKTDRDNDYRNIPENKLKRQQFAIKLLEYVAAEKKILYLDETNFNIWVSRSYGWSKAGTRAVDLNTTSKERNIHVIATISREGVEYHEGRFGSFDNGAANDYVLAMLRDQATRGPLSNVVVVVDNAPCHSRIEEVFDEAAFAGAECLRLGPYSPMLNGIENVFSAYKAAVKRYMTANRASILNVPEHTTIVDHRSSFLLHAASSIFPEVVTEAMGRRCIHHTFAFIADAILLKDMQVGK